MKRFFSIAVAFVLATSLLSAQSLDKKQEKLRSQIVSFLNKKGLDASVNEDGDVHFMKNDLHHLVSINPSEQDPMFVAIMRNYEYGTTYTRDVYMLASHEVNKYKDVKVLCWDDHYSLRAEMFISDFKQFATSFDRDMEYIESVDEDYLDECRSVQFRQGAYPIPAEAVPFLITKIEMGNVDVDYNKINDFGDPIYEYQTQYLAPKVTIQPIVSSGSYTCNVRLFKDDVMQEADDEPNGYSFTREIVVNGEYSQTKELTGRGRSEAGNYKAGAYRIEFWYGNFCLGSANFRIY